MSAPVTAGLGPPGGVVKAPAPAPRRRRKRRRRHSTFVAVSPTVAVPRHRGRRRRRRRYGHHGLCYGPYVTLPIGARVYTSVGRLEKDPDRRRRRTWAWCEVVETKPKSATVFLRPDGASPDDPLVKQDSRGCYVRSSIGRWVTLLGARDRRHPVLWWWDDTDIRSYRIASELEVALYAEGFVPHPNWRLMDGPGPDQAFVELPKPEKIWLAKPEPPSDEEIADAKEAKRTKKRASALAHAKTMLTMWERSKATAAKRASKWKAAVRRLEKPK